MNTGSLTKENMLSNEKLNVFLCLMSSILIVFPSSNYYFPRYISIFFEIIWLVDILRQQKWHFLSKTEKNFIFFLFISYIYDIFLKLINFSSAAIGNYFISFLFFSVIVKAIFIQRFYSDEAKRFVLKVIKACIFFCVINNIYWGIQSPGIQERQIFYYDDAFKWRNIGVTEFYNMLVFYVGSCFFSIYTEKKQKRLINVIELIATLVFLLTFSPRLIAVCASIVLCILIYGGKAKRKYKYWMNICLVLIISITLFVIFYDKIIEILPERITIRIKALLEDKSGSSNSEYLGRFDLVLVSLKTFVSRIDTFVFGIGYHTGDKYMQVIGQHALFPDYLARYGCLGLIFVILFFIFSYKVFVSNKESNMNKNYARAILFVIFFMTFIGNPFRAEIAISSFMFIGLLFSKNKKEKVIQVKIENTED